MDVSLQLITDTYSLFSQFYIYVPQEDYDKVEGLQVLFNKMLENVSYLYINISSISEFFFCRRKKYLIVYRKWRNRF